MSERAPSPLHSWIFSLTCDEERRAYGLLSVWLVVQKNRSAGAQRGKMKRRQLRQQRLKQDGGIPLWSLRIPGRSLLFDTVQYSPSLSCLLTACCSRRRVVYIRLLTAFTPDTNTQHGSITAIWRIYFFPLSSRHSSEFSWSLLLEQPALHLNDKCYETRNIFLSQTTS